MEVVELVEFWEAVVVQHDAITVMEQKRRFTARPSKPAGKRQIVHG